MNQQGAMLIDIVLGFSLFCIVISVFPLFLPNTPHVSSQNTSYYEKTVFFNQLSMELRETTSLDIQGNTLILTKANGSAVSYEQYGTFLRRRVNDAGHEIILTGLKKIIFSPANYGIMVNVIDEFDYVYQKRFTLPYVWKLQENMAL